jgi:hypothetical protein
MPTVDKLAWIAAEAAAGVREIEVTSYVPPKLIPQFADAGRARQGRVAPQLRFCRARAGRLSPHLPGTGYADPGSSLTHLHQPRSLV